MESAYVSNHTIQVVYEPGAEDATIRQMGGRYSRGTGNSLSGRGSCYDILSDEICDNWPGESTRFKIRKHACNVGERMLVALGLVGQFYVTYIDFIPDVVPSPHMISLAIWKVMRVIANELNFDPDLFTKFMKEESEKSYFSRWSSSKEMDGGEEILQNDGDVHSADSWEW